MSNQTFEDCRDKGAAYPLSPEQDAADHFEGTIMSQEICKVCNQPVGNEYHTAMSTHVQAEMRQVLLSAIEHFAQSSEARPESCSVETYGNHVTDAVYKLNGLSSTQKCDFREDGIKPHLDAGWKAAIQEVAKAVAGYMELPEPKSPWGEWLPRFLLELARD